MPDSFAVSLKLQYFANIMTVTITDFAAATGISPQTVYSWIRRNKMPKGVALAGIGKSRILKVTKASDYFQLLETQLA